MYSVTLLFLFQTRDVRTLIIVKLWASVGIFARVERVNVHGVVNILASMLINNECKVLFEYFYDGIKNPNL